MSGFYPARRGHLGGATWRGQAPRGPVGVPPQRTRAGRRVAGQRATGASQAACSGRGRPTGRRPPQRRSQRKAKSAGQQGPGVPARGNCPRGIGRLAKDQGGGDGGRGRPGKLACVGRPSSDLARVPAETAGSRASLVQAVAGRMVGVDLRAQSGTAATRPQQVGVRSTSVFKLTHDGTLRRSAHVRLSAPCRRPGIAGDRSGPPRQPGIAGHCPLCGLPPRVYPAAAGRPPPTRGAPTSGLCWPPRRRADRSTRE